MNSRAERANTFLKYYFIGFNILLVATYIGVGVSTPTWLSTFDYYLKIAISGFLLYRFNPFKIIVFNELDRRIAFSAGMILFTSSVLNKILPDIITKYRGIIISKIKNKYII